MVEAHTCRSRGVHVACTRTFNGQGARKKIRPRTYIQAGSRTPTRAYVRPGLVYMAGSERETASSSCSWGANRLGQNGMRHHVHREGLDGTCDGNKAWRTAERRKRPCVRPATFETGSCSSGGVWRTTKQRKRTSYGRNGVLLIGRGVAYRKTDETDLLWSKRGSC